MSLLAISYPELSAEDYAWIQEIRAQYDSHYKLVEPHFTLLFETDKIRLVDFSRHVNSIANQVTAIKFNLRCAKTVPELDKTTWYTFLVPDEGNSNIIKLHDRLYTNVFENELRPDIAYIPHMTICISKEYSYCKTLADNLNDQDFSIPGLINSIDIVSYENDKIETLEKVILLNG